MPKQKLQDERPIRQKLGVVAVAGDPTTNRLVGALADAQSLDSSEETKAKAKDLRKRIANGAVYGLLSRAAATGELPHTDELDRLNISQKSRQKLVAAARRIKHEAESPVRADEERDSRGRVKVTGYTHPQHAAKSMAWDLSEEIHSEQRSDWETKDEIEARQAANNSEAVADAVWARTRG
jgi:hypothetical protein